MFVENLVNGSENYETEVALVCDDAEVIAILALNSERPPEKGTPVMELKDSSGGLRGAISPSGPSARGTELSFCRARV